MRQEEQELGGATGEGDHQDSVVGFDDPEVAVEGFGRVEEAAEDAQGVESGDELLADLAGLADADNDNFAVGLDCGSEGGDGGSETVAGRGVGGVEAFEVG